MLLLFVLLVTCTANAKVAWAPWSSWAEDCPRLCSDIHGFQKRHRLCMICNDNSGCIPSERPSVTRFCEGPATESRQCYTASQCQGKGHITGEWTGWRDLGACRTNPPGGCGQMGIRYQTRECRASATTDITTTFRCPAKNKLRSFRQRACFQDCPEGRARVGRAVVVAYGEWTTWSGWMCNEDCNAPDTLAYRSRECSGQTLGYTCSAGGGHGEYDARPCQTTDGYLCRKTWSVWSPWSECEPACGPRSKTRTRSCMGHGGPCEGAHEERQQCTPGTPCKNVDGHWSEWSIWSQVCSSTCGGGVHTRYRECDNPPPLGNGKACVGRDMETKPCETTGPCPMDGGWGQWSEWVCSASCGSGTGERYRKCNNPSPRLSGNPCEGKSTETKADACSNIPCPQHGSAPSLPEGILAELKDALKKMYNNYERVEHQSVAFVCGTNVADKIRESYPRTSTFWIKNGQPLTLDASRMTYQNGDLLIQSVTAADIGVYLCQLEWQPRLRQTVGVYVLVVKSNYKLHTRPHRNLQLNCNGAALGLLYGGLQQIWFHNGEIYKDYGGTPPQTVNVEKFENIGPDFAGLWECVINEPNSLRLWITNRVNVTVGSEILFLDRLMSNRVYSIGSIVTLVSAVVAIAVCCLYQDRKAEKNAESEVQAYQELMDEDPSILEKKANFSEKKQKEAPSRGYTSTESSSFVSDEGLHLRDGGTVHTPRL